MLRQLVVLGWAGLLAALLTLPAAAADGSDWADGSGADFEVRPNLVYQQAAGVDLKLDLYLPHDRKRPRPLVIWVHGGGWVGGSREVANLHLTPWLQMGWAVANVSYRLAKHSPAPAAVEDVRCALRWLTERAGELGLDRERIVLTGSSAGAHLALMAGMLPPHSRFDRGCPTQGDARWRTGVVPPLKVAAIVNLMGITDLPALLSADAAGRNYAIEWFGALAEPARNALARELSPLHQVQPSTPPILSFHGDADDVVPFAQAQGLHAALAAAQRPNRLVPVPGARHSFSRQHMVMMMRQTRAFLAEHAILRAPVD
jgi:acetyl esterase/lipase